VKGARDNGLEDRLGHRFSDPTLLLRALTHRSFAHEHAAGRGENYERLEFLGDALLGLIVSEWLWRDDPGAAEGSLTRRKQSVVRTEALAAVARELRLGEALRLGRGEEGTGGRGKASLLADVFEAVLGAVYEDGGIRVARAFVRRHLSPNLRATRAGQEAAEDHKTRLQERVQSRLQPPPLYRIVTTVGPAHSREFSVEVLVGDEVLGTGKGSSRKRAEQEAANEALGRLDPPGE